MASRHLFLLLTFLLAFAAFAIAIETTTITISPAPSPISPPSHLSPTLLLPQEETLNPHQEAHFNAIIDAIIGAGDFSNWANLLAEADPATIPLSATIFIPDDEAFLADFSPTPATPANFSDPLLFLYHIVPRRFSIYELQLFPIGVRLPTLCPGNTILITNNSASNFTLNGVNLTRPNIFQNAVVSVHGVESVLDYTLFGNDDKVAKKNRTSSLFASDQVEGEMTNPPVLETSAGERRSKPRIKLWVGVCVLVFTVLLIFRMHLGLPGTQTDLSASKLKRSMSLPPHANSCMIKRSYCTRGWRYE